MEVFKYAHISELAYQDNPKLHGYEVAMIEDVGTDTQVFIFFNDVEQIVAFRGTAASISNIKDIQTDLDFKVENGTHKGFMEAYNSIAQILIDALDFRKLTVYTGHSLGGALAIIACSMDLSERKICITFGAPRVFTSEQASVYNELNKDVTFRFESECDPVPFLPPYIAGYRHVGNLLYINNKGAIIEDNVIGGFFSFLFSKISTKLSAHSISNYKNLIKKAYLQ